MIRPTITALIFALAAIAWPATAEDQVTLEDLQREGRLQVASSITPERDIVPGQKLRLVLEVATDRWFTGGTRIVVPEVPGLVILQTEQFASNASENRRGQNWVVQRWTLDVFPQRKGEFSIPAIAMEVSVNVDVTTEVVGRIQAPGVYFEAVVPAALESQARWVAAPAFSVKQDFDRSLDKLQVGDAFEREIRFEAADLQAMMLPELKVERIPGLALYPAPPQLENMSNRGETTARRTQRISYVVEAEGHYRLSGADFAWWDTGSSELRLLSLPPTEIRVGSGGDNRSGEPPLLSRAQWLLLLGGLVLLAALAWLARKLLPGLPWNRLADYLQQFRNFIADLRRPALPAELNPGSSAGE